MTSRNLFSTQDTKQGSCTYELKELAKKYFKTKENKNGIFDDFSLDY